MCYLFFSFGLQSCVLARRFSRAVGARKLATFLWMKSVGSSAFPFIAKAMEKALNCCNCEWIADSDLDKHKPVDHYTGEIPQRERLL